MSNSVHWFLFLLLAGLLQHVEAQSFIRTELSTELESPWEITYGPDGFLWLTEGGGKVSRVNPVSGNKQQIYDASDYFNGAESERHPLCHQPKIGSGTLGLTLHPDFMVPESAFIYFVYSYNSGTEQEPRTRFKIVRLLWNHTTQSASQAVDLITDLPNGHDHLGGRLMALKRNGQAHLYLSIGDNGLSAESSPTCYNSPNENPNTWTQDPDMRNGKIHRFHMDGSIPADNPIPGNSFYTRGHRNPQGLMYNSKRDILYDIEHGDRTDDEINVLVPGMNYGWKDVRGYHDGNHTGEIAFIENYVPHPDINGDKVQEALYAWCQDTPASTASFLEWCTVAPSDGIYYGKYGIPGWHNSLLVVTLKQGSTTNKQVFRFQLNEDGTSLTPSTANKPNPTVYFAEDQEENGRLRDIALSPDGGTIYLINNGGAQDKITVYTYDPSGDLGPGETTRLYPNPANDQVNILSRNTIAETKVLNLRGDLIWEQVGNISYIDISDWQPGLYSVQMLTTNGSVENLKLIKL